MAKTKQVMKVEGKYSKYTVIFHEDSKINPYWIYQHYWDLGQRGYYTERKRIYEKYGDLRSCLCCLEELVCR